MPSPATRQSVRLSHGWINQKQLKLRLCNLHRTVAPIHLVFAGYVSSRNYNGFSLSGGIKQETVGVIKQFSIFIYQYTSKVTIID